MSIPEILVSKKGRFPYLACVKCPGSTYSVRKDDITVACLLPFGNREDLSFKCPELLIQYKVFGPNNPCSSVVLSTHYCDAFHMYCGYAREPDICTRVQGGNQNEEMEFKWKPSFFPHCPIEKPLPKSLSESKKTKDVKTRTKKYTAPTDKKVKRKTNTYQAIYNGETIVIHASDSTGRITKTPTNLARFRGQSIESFLSYAKEKNMKISYK